MVILAEVLVSAASCNCFIIDYINKILADLMYCFYFYYLSVTVGVKLAHCPLCGWVCKWKGPSAS